MIFIFDDTNPLYINEYIDFEDYTDVIEHISEITMDALSSLTPALQKAEWILIHRSFKNKFQDQYNYIVRKISVYGEDVPLMLFSDEDLPKPEIDEDTVTYIISFKKSVLYTNLAAFLDDRRTNSSCNVNILFYGENSSIHSIVAKALSLLKPIRLKSDMEYFEPTILPLENLMSLVNLSKPNINTDYDTIVKQIAEKELTVGEFKKKLNRLIDSFIRYGKNIHNW